MSTRYSQSEELLSRACRTIPLGSQTFSKSKVNFPYGVSPFFIERGQGSRVWDVDGNEYIDFVNGLLCVSLGYGDPDVDAAVQAQMQNGVSFSLPHRLEMEVAERLVDLIPCAEMVRFGKNGTDATSAAVRLARAYTGRDHIVVCGYHGWQDWYIGSTSRDLGVPGATKALTHSFTYNDTASLERLYAQHPEQIAAVIMEPMNVAYPAPGFLESVRELTQANGSLLVFDEMITGFRFHLGGAQALFGVTPDLATFGKGLGNGYPLSAIVGRRDVMMLMEDIFFSGTFGGETLSLAAAKAVLDKMTGGPVLESIHRQGEHLMEGVRRLIGAHDLGSVLSISGHPSWSFMNFTGTGAYSVWEIKTLFLQEVFARGVLTQGTHNLSYSHNEADITQLFDVYDEVLAVLSDGLRSYRLRSLLQAEPLVPLFKVR